MRLNNQAPHAQEITTEPLTRSQLMKRLTCCLLVPSLAVPAFLAYTYARHVISNFFPDLTIIDLGTFYAIGLASGIAAGICLLVTGRIRTGK